MKKRTLKLHKTKIVKLTNVSKIVGGSENSETTYTSMGNDETTTAGSTAETISNLFTYCTSSYPDDSCLSHTNDTDNGNNSVPTFNPTQPLP